MTYSFGADSLDISETANAWKSRYKPILDWDRMFADGDWDYLNDASEAARYALIAGYVHRRPTPIKLLDVGCGAGLLCRYLDHGRIVYSGIDLSEAAIGQARETFGEADFSVSDITQYQPPAGQTFDVIVFNEVLPHVDDPVGSLDRYMGFLQPSGMMIISTYQNVNTKSNAAMFTGLLEEALTNGRFRSLTRCEVVTFEKGLKWRIDVIADAGGTNADD